MENLASIFPNGPCLTHNKLDIIVANVECMFYSVFQSYFTDFFPVLELSEGLGDPDHVYKRKVVTISFPMLTITGQTPLFPKRTLDVTMTSL